MLLYLIQNAKDLKLKIKTEQNNFIQFFMQSKNGSKQFFYDFLFTVYNFKGKM
jgi:hypothetical protein